MNRRRCLFVTALSTLVLGGCGGFTFDVGAGGGSRPPSEPRGGPEREPGPYGHLPRRTSFCAKSSVELKEGCYEGDFVLGAAQIRVSGAGVGKTVIHGNLVLQTQCVVSKLTVLGDVIFEGHQAELVEADFFGRIVDKGSQNRY